MYTGYMGINRNNATELEALICSLKIVMSQDYMQAVVEGDTQILINIISKIQNEIQVKHLSYNW